MEVPLIFPENWSGNEQNSDVRRIYIIYINHIVFSIPGSTCYWIFLKKQTTFDQTTNKDDVYTSSKMMDHDDLRI